MVCVDMTSIYTAWYSITAMEHTYVAAIVCVTLDVPASHVVYQRAKKLFIMRPYA